ncbi:hypothetical protein D3C71_188300 [compost metagenome]
MLTKNDGFLEHAAQDILLAFGEEAERAWRNYRAVVDRISPEVESGEYARLTPKDVGHLHKLGLQLEPRLPDDYAGALRRLSLDKDYHGHATVGMADLLAIRSVEDALPSWIDEALYIRLADKPLVVLMLKELRGGGRSRGIVSDLQLVTSMAKSCLSLVLGKALDSAGSITSDEIKQIHDVNGLEKAQLLEVPNRIEDFFVILLDEDEDGR